MSHILIAEDELLISSFVEKGLRSQGYTTLVSRNGLEIVDLVHSGDFDLLILDLGLPGKDGLQVLEELRCQGHYLPIIILTARSDVHDKVTGLEGGADDYITKPFRFEELLARVRARLRTITSTVSAPEIVLKVGDASLDLRNGQMQVGDCQFNLPAREFALAEMFFRSPGLVLSREELFDRVWGMDHDSVSNLVDVYVGYLRKKLGNGMIETVRGVGYRLKVE